MPAAKRDSEPLIQAEDAVGTDARARVPWAGLLADQPHRASEQHTHGEWQDLLDAYLRSERI